MNSKSAFLEQITAQTNMRSLKFDSTDFEGSSPPSVFVGRANYPKVFVGPMLSKQENSYLYDAPEQWLNNYNKNEIINFRLGLLRGTKTVNIEDVDSRYSQQMQDIALSKNSLHTNVEFNNKPSGITFNEDHSPFGPSAEVNKLSTDSPKWEKYMQKAHYDYDLLAGDAIIDLEKKGLPFTTIQKALSTGAFGKKRKRRLVPTRWSITAADDTLSKNKMDEVRENEVIDEYRVYESEGLSQNFKVLLTPTSWQYEALEAFFNVKGAKGTFAFADYERFNNRTKYSKMGGCYYAQRLAVAEQLQKEKEQAGAFVFREVHEDYTPTGVWVCRELTKEALKTEPKTFKKMSDAFHYINDNTRWGFNKFKEQMPLLQDLQTQKRLLDFY